jgi:hypothetical protein
MKCPPKGSCTEVLVPNAAVFIGGVWGNDWIMKTVTSSMKEAIDGVLVDGIIGRLRNLGGGAYLEMGFDPDLCLLSLLPGQNEVISLCHSLPLPSSSASPQAQSNGTSQP